MAEYQGHRSWNAWNVSLYIANEEPLYRRAVDLIRRHGERKAACIMTREMRGERTPDGAVYNFKCIREALEGLEVERPSA